MREGLATLVGLIEGVDVVGTASDGVEAVERARSDRPDVVLMDLRMPRMEGADATRQIRAEVPTAQVLVLTTYADDASLFPALIFHKTGVRDRAQAVRYAYQHGLAGED